MVSVPQEQCYFACAGEPTWSCGAADRIQVYAVRLLLYPSHASHKRAAGWRRFHRLYRVKHDQLFHYEHLH